ncbi:MAG: response regulator [Magnetococcales bacterium]|nr:response regulator [Magnetococcales bacterium]
MRCLVVDDEQVTQILMQAMLEHYGQCDVATTGSESVTMFKEALQSDTPYSLICMDIKLDGMDGLETLRHIRLVEKENSAKERGPVKVFMVTSHTNIESIKTAFYEIQCDEYIQKPVDPYQLRQRLLFHRVIKPPSK